MCLFGKGHTSHPAVPQFCHFSWSIKIVYEVHLLCPIAVNLQGWGNGETHDRFVSFRTNCANASGEKEIWKINQSRGGSPRQQNYHFAINMLQIRHWVWSHWSSFAQLLRPSNKNGTQQLDRTNLIFQNYSDIFSSRNKSGIFIDL